LLRFKLSLGYASTELQKSWVPGSRGDYVGTQYESSFLPQFSRLSFPVAPRILEKVRTPAVLASTPVDVRTKRRIHATNLHSWVSDPCPVHCSVYKCK